MVLEGFNQLPLRFIPQKIFQDLNSAINYKNPNGPHPLGLVFYFLQILLDPLGGGHPVLLPEGSIENGFALEARALRDTFDGRV